MINSNYQSLMIALRAMDNMDFEKTVNSRFLIQFRKALEYCNSNFKPEGPMYLFLSRSDLSRLVLNIKVNITLDLTHEQIYDLANAYARTTFKALSTLNMIAPDATNIDIIDAYCKESQIVLN